MVVVVVGGGGRGRAGATDTQMQGSFSVALRPQRPYGLLGSGTAQDGHLDFHTAPEL